MGWDEMREGKKEGGWKPVEKWESEEDQRGAGDGQLQN